MLHLIMPITQKALAGLLHVMLIISYWFSSSSLLTKLTKAFTACSASAPSALIWISVPVLIARLMIPMILFALTFCRPSRRTLQMSTYSLLERTVPQVWHGDPFSNGQLPGALSWKLTPIRNLDIKYTIIFITLYH